ncbi:MAG: PEGA domain-containing protein [bacterium]|nr:PEGA domain-containing protein [bacterium]
MKRWLLLFSIIVFVSSSAFARQRVAVLDFTEEGNYREITSSDVGHVTNLVREEARLMLPTSEYILMTRENILDLIGDRSIADCIGDCAVETGRSIGADYIVTGRVYKFSGQMRVSIDIHETEDGNLLSTVHAGAPSLLEVEPEVTLKARKLFVAAGLEVNRNGGHKIISDNSVGWEIGDQGKLVVDFNSDPEGATIEINGRPMWLTPCSRPMDPGMYEVSMKKMRYLPHTETVIIVEGSQEIIWDLEPNFGWLNIRSEPSELQVSINDRAVGRTPIDNYELASGTHVVFIADPSFHRAGEQIFIESGERHNIYLEPAPRQGGIRVNAVDELGNAVNADVLVDGKAVGKTYQPIKLLVGEYEVAVINNKYRWSKDITIEEGEYEQISAKIEDKIFIPKSDYGWDWGLNLFFGSIDVRDALPQYEFDGNSDLESQLGGDLEGNLFGFRCSLGFALYSQTEDEEDLFSFTMAVRKDIPGFPNYYLICKKESYQGNYISQNEEFVLANMGGTSLGYGIGLQVGDRFNDGGQEDGSHWFLEVMKVNYEMTVGSNPSYFDQTGFMPNGIEIRLGMGFHAFSSKGR